MSKARALRILTEAGSPFFVIDPFITFTVGEWRASPATVLKLISKKELGERVAVRSSASLEDVDPDLSPGLFFSALDVDPDSLESVTAAIERVISSFARHERAQSAGDANEVIVQRQLVHAKMSGVVRAGSLNSLFLSVDYAEEPGRTDTVTAGRDCKHVEVMRGAIVLAEPWRSIRLAVLAVEELLNAPILIEFGLSSESNIHVFQARSDHQESSPSSAGNNPRLALTLLEKAQSQIAAKRVLLSDMTDWNPSEMLGDRPRPLAVSLYQYLVTNDAWIRGRSSIGYRQVSPSVLVETYAGKPYVNVRRSFLSLVPASLNRELAEHLVEDRLEALRENPELHDKVELELLYTAADVTRPSRTTQLKGRGFSEREVDELDTHLRTLTRSAISSYPSFWHDDMVRLKRLAKWSKANQPEKNLRNPISLIRFAVQALGKCRDEGVVPFSRHARYAFIARDILGRLISVGCIDQAWSEAWWRSLNTVAKRVASALVDVGNGQLSRADCNAQFGHLRARTYDICSPRYDQQDFIPIKTVRPPISEPLPTLGVEAQGRIEAALLEAGLDMSSESFLGFAVSATEAREDIKFAFTSVLSNILEVLATIGDNLELSREDLSFLTIQDLNDAVSLRLTQSDLRSRWQDVFSARRENWSAGLHLPLPDVILVPEDLVVIRSRTARPNFVTRLSIEAEVVVLRSTSPDLKTALKGKIIVVEAADPGFDWVFAIGIAGLVTRYGGAASHMAIRCAEFGIPAGIGCGDLLFQKIVKAKRLLLDCAAGRIELTEIVSDT